MSRRRSSYYDDYWPRYSATRPIEVRDGIKAKSKRGKFVQNWWANRWIKALTSLMDSGRLSRGRTYARKGQVLEIEAFDGAHRRIACGDAPIDSRFERRRASR